MTSLLRTRRAAAVAAALLLLELGAQAQDPGRRGERVPEAAISPLVRETLQQVLERQRTMPQPDPKQGMWQGQDGRWFVPPETAKTPVHSGQIAIVNEWGDPRMAIAFPAPVDLLDVHVAGHGVAPARAVRFVGFRNGAEVAHTGWLPLGGEHRLVKLGFSGVDRLEVLTVPYVDRMGFVALDDLRLAPAGRPDAARSLDFEDLAPRAIVTGTGYAGLTWEAGSGFRTPLQDAQIVPAPQTPPAAGEEAVQEGGVVTLGAVDATTPATWDDFNGVTLGEPGATLVPPDTCGANGPDHYVVIVNANLSAWTKVGRTRVLNVGLNAFWNVTGLIGDPRIVYDPHAQRYVALATTFSNTRTIYLAISATTDPAGAWYKFSFRADQGSDAGKWPDYPTLGVDARGIYCAAYMVSPGMTIWAIDKAPLLANPPAVGTVTAFRGLPFEGAIQPCVTYGDPGSQYLVSRQSSTLLRVRRVVPPLTAPTLVEAGSVTVPSNSTPPSAPALGSTTNISTIDTRPINAVYRNGAVWTVHGINVSSRAACRWYEIGTAPLALKQYGTLADPLWHYYYASIAVDAHGNVGLGFSGSHAGVYCSTFVSGRRATDPAGLSSAPMLVKAGEASWNRVDGAGRNRFGDYSMIDVDAVDDLGFWTNQEFISAVNVWRTRITRFGFEAVNYGDGLAGTSGVPALGVAARPVIGQTTTLHAANSSGVNNASGVLVIGLQTAALPVLGGTLLVNPTLALPLPIPTPRLELGIPIPNTPALVGNPVFFQCVQVDAGASQGVAFSRGLELRPGSR
ncbi:MAG: hypothetical protein IT458_18410 [Planctomycetes bacterium]|nr:hypothetical protein [Planctomycetota bacterium]